MESFKGSIDNFILIEISDIELKIDENLLLLQNIVSNKYSEPMKQ